MRILFINQYYAPDYAATAQILSDVCEHLAEEGHEVHVLASRAVYDGRNLELPSYEKRNGVHVHRLSIRSTSRARIRHRLMGYLGFYWKAFFRANLMRRPDVVVALTTPPMIAFLGAWLRLVRRARFLYWVMDIYPDIALKSGVIKPRGIIRAMWSALGRFGYYSANRVVVLGEDMKETIVKKRVRPDKVHVVNCWSSGEDVYPMDPHKNSFRQSQGMNGGFTLMYSGNMGVCHSFDSVISGFSSLTEKDPINAFFIGGGKQEPLLREELAPLNGRVRFLPYQDRQDLAASLSAPDAHLITLNPLFDGLLVPSKIYGIMAAARAILFVGSQNNEVARIVQEADCGVIVDPDDPDGFVEATRWMQSHPKDVREMGERGRRYFEEHFEKRIGLESFKRVLFHDLSQDAATSPNKLPAVARADSPAD